MNECIMVELKDLIQRGFRLTAYFDGKNQMKSHTAEKRRQEVRARWDNVYKLCNRERGNMPRYVET
jgi:hypothetical protein